MYFFFLYVYIFFFYLLYLLLLFFFAPLSYISTSLNVEAVKRYIHLFSPSAATASLPSAVSESPSGNKKLSFGRSDSITSTSSAVIPHVSENIALEIGVLNQDVIWTRQARKGTEVVTDLLTQLVELCNMFAYEWAAIAGSTEFKAFIYDCSELQKVKNWVEGNK